MERIKVGLPDGTSELINQRRGSVPLSAWVRDLVLAELEDGPRHGVPIQAASGVMKGNSIRATKPSQRPRPHPPVSDQHRHRYEKTGQTRPKGNGRGVEHEKVCPGCADTKWEGR